MATAIVFGASWLTWSIIKWTISARVTPVVESLGHDAGELGIEAYPKFVLFPDSDE